MESIVQQSYDAALRLEGQRVTFADRDVYEHVCMFVSIDIYTYKWN